MEDEHIDEIDDDQAPLNDLDATWGFVLDMFLQERRKQARATCDAGDGKAETIGSSRRRAVDASSVPAGRSRVVSAPHQLLALTEGTVSITP